MSGCYRIEIVHCKRLDAVPGNLAEVLRIIVEVLWRFLPVTAEKRAERLAIGLRTERSTAFAPDRADAGRLIPRFGPLFPGIELD